MPVAPSDEISARSRARAGVCFCFSLLAVCVLSWAPVQSHPAARSLSSRSTGFAAKAAGIAAMDQNRSEQSGLERLRSLIDLTNVGPGFENARFHTCALVGSGDILVGAKRGKEIDAHDYVIRVNRIPTSEFVEDFGNRTDIITLVSLRRRIQYMGDRHYASSIPVSQPIPNCSDARSGCHAVGVLQVWGPASSDFDWLFTDEGGEGAWLRGGGAAEGWLGEGGVQSYPLPNWQSHPLVGVVHTNVTDLILTLLPQKVSSGFRAFVVFAALCDQLDVYGFGSKNGSDATADGHPEVGHNLDGEHAIEYMIAAGDWSRIMSPSAMSEWYKGHVGNVKIL